jgi:hypothetical protein
MTNHPMEWTSDHPVLEIPQWRNLGVQRFSPVEASRHLQFTGEPGGGKSASGIKPILYAALAYPSEAAYVEYAQKATAKQRTPEPSDSLRPALLVIDPKAELEEFVIRSQAQIGGSRRVIVLSLANQQYIMHLFEGLSAGEMAASDVADRILSNSIYLEREMKARDPFWGQSARRVIRAFLAVDHYLFKRGGIDLLTSFWDAVESQVSRAIAQADATPYNFKHKAFEDVYTRFNAAIEAIRDAAIRLSYRAADCSDEVEAIHAAIQQFHGATTDHERGSRFDRLMDKCRVVAEWCAGLLKKNPKLSEKKAEMYLQFLEAFKRAESIGDTLMAWAAPQSDPDTIVYTMHGLPLAYNPDIYLAHLFTLLNLSATYHHDNTPQSDIVLSAYLAVMRRFKVDLPQEISTLQGLNTLAPQTYSSVIAIVNGILTELSSPEFAQHISLNPYEAPPAEKWLSVREMMDEGTVVVYTPGENTTLSNLVGRCMKRMFFGFVFRRTNMIRPFVYIADEAQRFLTSDPESGEASFLERCRAFRGICVLATQSIASLRYALEAQDSSTSAEGRFALPMLLNNIGSFLYFRSSDQETQQRLYQMLPAPSRPDRPHVITVRPISTLKVGEAYYLFSGGQMGRGQITL